MNILLRAEGKMKIVMFIASGSFLLNIILDTVLIVWAGWGIRGATWTTVTAQVAYFFLPNAVSNSDLVC